MGQPTAAIWCSGGCRLENDQHLPMGLRGTGIGCLTVIQTMHSAGNYFLRQKAGILGGVTRQIRDSRLDLGGAMGETGARGFLPPAPPGLNGWKNKG